MNRKCSSCKKTLCLDRFGFKPNGDLYKTCDKCLETKKEYRIENKEKIKETKKEYYIENKEKIKETQKEYRIENKEKIKETQKKYYIENKEKIKETKKEYYIENKEKIKETKKEYYIENKEKQQCTEHSKYQCKICKDAIKITIRNWIGNSRRSDKKFNRFDANNFIDRCFLEGLIEDCEEGCHYCKKQVQFVNYNDSLASIERLDNSIGHIKSNCVIACLLCNRKHRGTGVYDYSTDTSKL